MAKYRQQRSGLQVQVHRCTASYQSTAMPSNNVRIMAATTSKPPFKLLLGACLVHKTKGG